jgi:hypothetical protein
MLILKNLKNSPTCFDHYSDHLQGARRFLVKVAEFKKQKLQKVCFGDAAVYSWCVCVAFYAEKYFGLISPTYLSSDLAVNIK